MNDERKHLTGREIEKLLAAVKGARNEARDRCLLMVLFWNGLWGIGGFGAETARGRSGPGAACM